MATFRSEKCDRPMCDKAATVHFTRVENRLPTEEEHRCEEHAAEVGSRYRFPRTINAIAPILSGAAAFDIDFMFYDETRGIGTVCLHELGGQRRLTFMTGYCESYGLDFALRRFAGARPLTHSLMARIIMDLEGKLDNVLVDRFIEADQCYHAKLHIRHGERLVIVDARPSDALILAVTCDTPIFVASDVLAKLS